MSATICEIIPTFNRPRLLREALASVAAARPDQLIVIDDGSDYDVRALCADFPVTAVVSAPPMPIERRMVAPRQGRLINEALGRVRCDVASLLCDDDIRAVGWYDELRAAFGEWPRRKLVRGTWLLFEDGASPGPHDPPSPMCQARKMTAGNFAWRADLTRSGAARWPEDRLNCLDDGFLWSLQYVGAKVFNVPCVGFAGWRREHAKANGNYSDGSRHTEAYRAVLAGGMLE